MCMMIRIRDSWCLFFDYTATTEIYTYGHTLSRHDALPISLAPAPLGGDLQASTVLMLDFKWSPDLWGGKRAQYEAAVGRARAAQVDAQAARLTLDRKSRRLHSSH